MERETFTSTKLQLHLYTDNACSVHYDDGRSKKQHVKNGYDVNGLYFGTKVSFRPPFYTCQTCQPSWVSDSFRKSSSYWYDDDYISENGHRREYDDDANGDGANNNNNGGDDDAYFKYGDDAYDPNYSGDDDYYNRNYVSVGLFQRSKCQCMRLVILSFSIIGSSPSTINHHPPSSNNIRTMMATRTTMMDGPGPAGPTREKAMGGRVTRMAEMTMFIIVAVSGSMTRRKVFFSSPLPPVSSRHFMMNSGPLSDANSRTAEVTMMLPLPMMPMSTIRTTMPALAIGTCAPRFASTVCGVMLNVVHLIPSESMSGRHRISFCSLSCASSWRP